MSSSFGVAPVQLSLDRFSSGCALTSTTTSSGNRAHQSPCGTSEVVLGGARGIGTTAATAALHPSLLPPARPATCRRGVVRRLTCAQASLESSSSSSSSFSNDCSRAAGIVVEVDGNLSYGGSVRHPHAETTMENARGDAMCHGPTTSRGGEEETDKWAVQMAALARGLGQSVVVLLAAGALLASSPNEAMAAKTGGRVGGSAFRSAPRVGSPSGPRINSRTYNSNPPVVVAPPVFGGYGGGFFPFGGYGYSPFGLGFGPVIGIGGGGLFQFLFLMFVANFIFSFIRNLTDRDED